MNLIALTEAISYYSEGVLKQSVRERVLTSNSVNVEESLSETTSTIAEAIAIIDGKRIKQIV